MRWRRGTQIGKWSKKSLQSSCREAVGPSEAGREDKKKKR